MADSQKPNDDTLDKSKINNALAEIKYQKPEDRLKWIVDNTSTFGAKDLYALVATAGEMGFIEASSDALTAASPSLASRFNDAQTQFGASEPVLTTQFEPTDYLAIATKRLHAAKSAGDVTTDLLGDGNTTPAQQAAVDQATKNEGDAVHKDKGTSAVDATANAALAFKKTNALGIPGSGNLPDWVRSRFGGVPPSPDQAQVLLGDWNSTHPDQHLSTPDDLWPKLAAQTPAGLELVDAAIQGRDPQTQHVYSVGATMAPGPWWLKDQGITSGQGVRTPGTNVVVSQDALTTNAAFWSPLGQTATGSNDFLGQVIRAANRVGLKTPDGNSVGWQPLASLYKMTQDAPQTVPQPGAPSAGSDNHQAMEDASKVAAANAGNGPDTASKLQNLAILFQQGMTMYGGDATLAALYASGNKVLVDRMAMAYHGQLDAGDQAQAQQILARGGWDTAQLAKAGYQTSSPWFDNITKSSANAYGGLDTTRLDANAAHELALSKQRQANSYTVNKADPAYVRQQVVDMWQQMFESKPTDKQINTITAKIDSLVTQRAAIAGVSGGNTVSTATDVGAEVRAAAQASPEYAQFYGNKPSGMTDTTYHQQFTAGAQSMLGAQAADPSAIRSGMQTGDFQTTIGQIANTGSSFNNSAFMQRLAQAATAVNSAT